MVLPRQPGLAGQHWYGAGQHFDWVEHAAICAMWNNEF